jgi:hypothetical protein
LAVGSWYKFHSVAVIWGMSVKTCSNLLINMRQ